jgi:RHS repeat-associated protein
MTNFSTSTDTLVKPDRLRTMRELEKKFGLDAQSIEEQAAAMRQHSDYGFNSIAASNTAAYPRPRILLSTRRITFRATLASSAAALLVVAGFFLLHFFSGNHQTLQHDLVSEPTATAFTFAHADDFTGDGSAAAFAPALGRYIESDPIGLAGSAPSTFSTYAYAGNNPLSAMDPSGLSVVYLNDKYAAVIAGSPRGHSAFIVGDDQTGWTYFSKNGGSDNVMQYYPNLQSFFANNASNRYDRTLWLATTPEQDKLIKNYAEAYYQDAYSGIGNNCGDLVDQSFAAGGINLPLQQVGVFPVTIPNQQYNDVLGLPISAPFVPPRPQQSIP